MDQKGTPMHRSPTAASSLRRSLPGSHRGGRGRRATAAALRFQGTLILFQLVMILAGGSAGEGAELRALWVTRWDYRSEEDVRRAVRWSAAFGFQRVFFQVRGRADAFYRSEIEPWGEEIGGRDPGFDPLAVAISEARKQAVELHAWVNVMPGWKGSKEPRDPSHVFHTRPEWFLVDRRGRRHRKAADDYTILNPCLPEVRHHLTRVITDIASRYAVDGLHLDYVRFIRRDPAIGRDFPYDETTVDLFRRQSGAAPAQRPSEWDDWRRQCVSTLVQELSAAARRARRGCTISVAAIQDYDRARGGLFQDVVLWQDAGWIDEVYPMTYAKDADTFAASVRSVLKRSKNPARVYPGIGVHLLEAPGELERQIEICRSLGAQGYALFAFASFFPSTSHESRRDDPSRRLRAGFRAALEAAHGVSVP
jgi:uncharacterized lipoprotein YddW (UPF0748 family)